jgi:hypothetical protein
MLNSEHVLPLIEEVEAAKKRAALSKGDTEFTLAEQLDFYRGADQAAANRFDVVAQAYRELLSRTTIKTYQGWEDGPEMSATDYLKPGDEVDEEMVDHFGGVVSPQYCTHQFTQVGEAEREENGRYFYMTFGRFGERYLYLGILPPFKQPKY